MRFSNWTQSTDSARRPVKVLCPWSQDFNIHRLQSSDGYSALFAGKTNNGPLFYIPTVLSDTKDTQRAKCLPKVKSNPFMLNLMSFLSYTSISSECASSSWMWLWNLSDKHHLACLVSCGTGMEMIPMWILFFKQYWTFASVAGTLAIRATLEWLFLAVHIPEWTLT